MQRDRSTLNKLLDVLEEAGVKFIGPTVHSDVRECKYPIAWTDTLRRYVQLTGDTEASVYVRFYLDLCVTVLTKRLLAIDIHHMVGADDRSQTKQESDMRTIHSIMFKMSISRMLVCVCECVLKRSPSTEGVAVEQASRLYTRLAAMLKERFYKNETDGNYYTKEKVDVSQIVHGIVSGWLLGEAFPNVVRATGGGGIGPITPNGPEVATETRLLSNDLSFFGVSHCYWLWLHLTAAGIQTTRAESDFLAMFYAFDLFIFCEHCSSHFVQHRSAFYTRDPNTGSVRTTYTAPEVVFAMHNVINRNTGKEVFHADILSDYKSYWERHALSDAGN